MVKVGIIGCGKIAQLRHAPEYSENPNAKIVGFYDLDAERCRAMAEKYGAVAFGSYDELLDSGIDVLSVCVANVDHAEVAIKALRAGKHVLCEKPFATTLADCEKMIATAKEQKKFLMIGQNQRFARAHVEGKKVLASGEVGRLLGFQTNFCHAGPESWTGVRDSWFFDRERAAFGAMADLGVHKTDLIHFLTGQRIVETMAVVGTFDKTYSDGRPITTDDNAYCLYTLENGATGTLHASWTQYGSEDNSTKLYCSKGVIRMYDDPTYSLIVEHSDGTVTPYELDKMATNDEQNAGKRTGTGVIDEFVRCVSTGTPPAVSAEDVLPAMKVIFANQLSSEKKRAVHID